jgi:hypothetical protein
VVCGDVFKSSLVDRKTVSRALEALEDVPVSVYLLPGNPDPLNAASVYRSTTFLERKPAHVHVIEDTTPTRVDEGIEIVGISEPEQVPPILPDISTGANSLDTADRIGQFNSLDSVDRIGVDENPAAIWKIADAVCGILSGSGIKHPDSP